MKHLLFALALVALLLAVSTVIAFADTPPDWEAAMTKCNGLPLATLETARHNFDALYGAKHNLTTDEQWKSSYIARSNEFSQLFGCGEVIGDDGLLTLKYRIDAPIFKWVYDEAPLPY